MNDFEEFRTRFEAGEFDEQFKSMSSPEDVVELAKSLGYNISLKDVNSVELDDDKFEMVAGGKNDTTNVVNHTNEINGNGNVQITF